MRIDVYRVTRRPLPRPASNPGAVVGRRLVGRVQRRVKLDEDAKELVLYDAVDEEAVLEGLDDLLNEE